MLRRKTKLELGIYYSDLYDLHQKFSLVSTFKYTWYTHNWVFNIIWTVPFTGLLLFTDRCSLRHPAIKSPWGWGLIYQTKIVDIFFLWEATWMKIIHLSESKNSNLLKPLRKRTHCKVHKSFTWLVQSTLWGLIWC